MMKGISQIFEKKAEIYSLHMKRKLLISKNEKYFNFLKMDKKNVQILKARIFYEKCVNCDDKNFLACGYKNNNFRFVTVKIPSHFWTFFDLAMFWQWFGNIFHRKNRKKSQMKLINKISIVNSLLTIYLFKNFVTDIFFSIAIDDFSMILR